MRTLKTLLLTAIAVFALAQSASAYNSMNPTSGPDNPLANHSWFIDWQWGMSQRQYLQYVTHYRLDTVDRLLYGPAVELVRGDARNELKRRMWSIMARKDPYEFLPLVRPHEHEKARLMLKIARNPQTKRFGEFTTHPYRDVNEYLDRMEEASPGAMAFLYLYRFPHRFKNEVTHTGGLCGNFDADGPRGDAAYKRWISAVADAVRGHRVVTYLEPDGLMTMKCLSRRAKGARYALFKYGIRKLKEAGATVYIDAGHSGWFGKKRSIRTKARMLKKAGVLEARGFFLNSTGYNWTHQEVAHGNKLVKLLGGKPRFIVSTAVNGNGPYIIRHRKLRYPHEQRCNPPRRALGPEPSVQTTSPYADAFMWIGDPGRSGAKCKHDGQPTGPQGGQWWEWYALELARGAGWQ